MKTILVTGGTGLVGRGIQIALEQEQQKVASSDETWIFLSSKDGDLRKLSVVESLFEKHKPSHVIHLAAFVGGIYKLVKYKVEYFLDNFDINTNVLRSCHKYNVQKCISCLSTCIFPDQTTYPLDETMLHQGPPHSSTSTYAYAKRMIDVLNQSYAEEYGCMFTSVIPTNVFGPHDDYNLTDGHVLPCLIHKCYLAKQRNEDMVLWGTGSALRQFIYSVDLGHLMLRVLREYNSVEPLILSAGEEDEVCIKEAAEEIGKAMEYKGKLKLDTTKSDGQLKKTASNHKLMTLFPDIQFTPFSQAIKASVDWFVENYEKARK